MKKKDLQIELTCNVYADTCCIYVMRVVYIIHMMCIVERVEKM